MHQILLAKGSTQVRRHSTQVRDPLIRNMAQCEYLIEGDTAWVEVANSAGLQMVNKEERSPDQACSVVSEFTQINDY